MDFLPVAFKIPPYWNLYHCTVTYIKIVTCCINALCLKHFHVFYFILHNKFKNNNKRKGLFAVCKTVLKHYSCLTYMVNTLNKRNSAPRSLIQERLRMYILFSRSQKHIFSLLDICQVWKKKDFWMLNPGSKSPLTQLYR